MQGIILSDKLRYTLPTSHMQSHGGPRMLPRRNIFAAENVLIQTKIS
jgi:hypothetical protein